MSDCGIEIIALLPYLVKNCFHFRFHKVNEMECLVKGNNFLLNNILDEAFTYDHHNDVCKYSFETINTKSQFPYLLVNIGTGVSIYKVGYLIRFLG